MKNGSSFGFIVGVECDWIINHDYSLLVLCFIRPLFHHYVRYMGGGWNDVWGVPSMMVDLVLMVTHVGVEQKIFYNVIFQQK